MMSRQEENEMMFWFTMWFFGFLNATAFGSGVEVRPLDPNPPLIDDEMRLTAFYEQQGQACREAEINHETLAASIHVLKEVQQNLNDRGTVRDLRIWAKWHPEVSTELNEAADAVEYMGTQLLKTATSSEEAITKTLVKRVPQNSGRRKRIQDRQRTTCRTTLDAAQNTITSVRVDLKARGDYLLLVINKNKQLTDEDRASLLEGVGNRF